MRVGMVPPARFERTTFPLGGGLSIQLSYGGISALIFACRAWTCQNADRPTTVRGPVPITAGRSADRCSGLRGVDDLAADQSRVAGERAERSVVAGGRE